MSDITGARPFARKQPEPLIVFTITCGDLQRDWTLSLEARERIVRECGTHMGWSGHEVQTHLESLRLNERERLSQLVDGRSITSNKPINNTEEHGTPELS